MIGQKGIPVLFGGIERHVEEVSLELAQKTDCSVFVYARSYYTSKKTKKYRKINIIHLPSLKTKHLDTISHVFLATWHALFKLKPEVIHYHGIGPGFWIWLPKVFSPRTKIVFTFHCRDYFHQKWGRFAQICLKFGEAMACLLADEVIPVSLELQKYVKKQYGRITQFVPHGIKLESPVPAKHIKKWGLKKNNYILAVSRLIPHKGIQYLIKAYQGLKTDKKLVLVGPCFYTEEYEQELKQLAQGNPQIIFLGEQRGELLKELYSNAFIFVHPSEQEGLPLTVLEAAGFGKPLLLSDIGIHREMFEDLPFFFRNKSVNDLKRNLKTLLNNPNLLKQRAKKIKQYTRQKYSWHQVVERIVLKYA